MAFSEQTKYEAKRRAAFRCCVCHKPFVEIHHLIPSSEGGGDSLDNAAPLCASCHDLYGGNPEKRKILRQMRDEWWELMAERQKRLTDVSEPDPPFEIPEDALFEGKLRSTGVAIYHRVFAKENFEISASILVKLVANAQADYPNRRRFLYLDIDGHRNKKKRTGFDHDMYELQTHFLGGFMMPYLSELHMPLGSFRNTKWQRNDVPNALRVFERIDQSAINEAIAGRSDGIWMADHGAMLRLPKTK